MSRVLYVMHSTNLIYGASKSLGILLRNVDYEFDLIVPKSTSNDISEQQIRDYFGEKLINIYRFWLPYEQIFLGKGKKNLLYMKTYKYYVKQLISYLYIYKIRLLIEKHNYNFIYLNSMTLYPLIGDKANYIMHVREIYSGSNLIKRLLIKKLNTAAGVIFIDNSTFEPFRNEISQSIILNNPFDMKNVRDINKNAVLRELQISENTVVVSIIGKISELKGIDFVIKTFKETNRKEIVLLIVGDVNNPYADYCKKISAGFDNIRFVGELKNADSIYAISDYIVRGDPLFAIGRTIYEGLYSGCNTIIPGTEINVKGIFDYRIFKEKIIFYPPRDEVSLLEVFNNCRKNDTFKDYPMSNIDSYLISHREFIQKSIGWKV